METMYVLIKRGTDIVVTDKWPSDINWDYDSLLQVRVRGTLQEVHLMDREGIAQPV